MAVVANFSKLVIDDIVKIGQSVPPLDKPIGSEYPYPPNGISVGSIKVPVTKKWTGGCLMYRAESAYNSGEIAQGFVSIGILKINVNSVQVFETRLQACLPFITVSGDEVVTLGKNTANGCFRFIGGIVLNSGQDVTVTFTPNYKIPIRISVTFVGTTGGVRDIREGNAILSTTTANQTVLNFTPGSDYLLKSISFDWGIIGQIAGFGCGNINNAVIMSLPWLGLGESSSNALDNKGYAGYGTGGIFIPLWGMTFYENEKFDMFANAHDAGNQIFSMAVFSNEEDISSGGGGGNTYSRSRIVNT